MTDNPPNHRTADGRFNTGPGGSLDLDHLFTYHPPHGDQVARYAELRAAGRAFAESLASCVPGSPERSTALARIREAVMWGNAGIACNERPPTEPRVHCVFDDCPFWVETGLGWTSGAPMLHSHLIAEHDIDTAVHISSEGVVHLDPDPRVAVDGLAPAQINTVPYQPDTPTSASSVQPMDDPYAAVTTVDVPTPSTAQSVCMITHEPPWCDGPCIHATPVLQPTADIPVMPVLDVNAPDPVAEARRYAAEVEQWATRRAGTA